MNVRASEATETGPRNARIVTPVESLAELVGGHPESIRNIFSRGAATDPGELGDAPSGRLLALEPLGSVHLLARPIVRLLARSSVWGGVGFDHGGNAGFNRWLGTRAHRFRTGVEPSELDGRPTLVLRYDRNGWPVSSLRDELRTVRPGLALGPFFVRAGERFHLIGWMGLEQA